jgi:hypothetical protein
VNRRIIDVKSNKGVARTGLLAAGAVALLLYNNVTALSGPCTTQIGQLEAQVANASPSSPTAGPTADQSVDAQLHHQPTPSTVGQAEHVANKDGDAAIERAKKADAANDAAGCNAALVVARQLYDLKD